MAWLMGRDAEMLNEMDQCFKVRRVRKFRGFDGNGNWVRDADIDDSFSVYTFGDHFLMLYASGDIELLFGSDQVYGYKKKRK